jgi:hypothetical protein
MRLRTDSSSFIHLSLVQALGFWTAYIVHATIFSKMLDSADEDGLREKKRTE